MAVDPATQFQQAGVTVPVYPGISTHLNPPIQLPGTGELWAKVGETALAAADRLQKSALNPAVRAQLQESVARSKLGMSHMAFLAKHPHWARAVTSESPQGASTVAPITQPVAQQSAQDIDWNQDTDSRSQESKQQQQTITVTRTGTNTGVDQAGKQYHETTPGSNQWISGPVTPNPPTDLNAGMAQGGLVRGYATGGSVDSSATDHAALLARMEQERRAAGLGEPFLNPATGSYEPLQTQAPQVAQPPQAQGGSIWSPQRPATAAPPAPDQPPQQPAQSQTPAAATKADQAAMQQWQEQNAHPVAPVSEALKWAKNNFDTRVQDVTYMPRGGPLNQPAYAFHMKGGGTNMVPLHQMVQNGFAPNVAGNNTSMTLSAAEQGQGQQPPQMQPTGAVGGQAPALQQGQGTQPTAQMQPTGAVGGQAPAAPDTQPANQMQPTGNVGQPQPPAAPGAYQMPQGPTITQTGNVNPSLMAGGTDEQALAASREAAAKAATESVKTSPDAVAKMEADDPNAAKPIYNWKTDENGKVYTALPDPQHPFYEQRYYKGNLTGFQSGPWNAENLRKQQLLDEFSGPGGVPIPKGTTIDYDRIKGFTPEEQNLWLRYARDYKLHPNAPLSTSPEGTGLTNAANAVKDAERIRDKILWLKQHHVPMDTISHAELIRSQEAGWSEASKGSLESELWKGLAGWGPKNNFADELRGDYAKLNTHLAGTPGGVYANAATPAREEWGGKLTWPVTTPDISLPKTTNVSTIDALNSIGSGDTHDQALAHIQEVLDNATADYKKVVAKLGPANFRVPDEDQKNLSDLADPKKGYLEDSNNKMWDKNHQTMVNGHGPIPYRPNPWFDNWTTVGGGESTQSTAASATPAPLPQISKYDTKEFDRLGIKKGDQYLGPDGKTTYTRGQ